jgi:AcrR family transcriptional regulator
MPDLAKRAGVGKATVYRGYATKAELIAAVADYRMRWSLRCGRLGGGNRHDRPEPSATNAQMSTNRMANSGAANRRYWL